MSALSLIRDVPEEMADEDPWEAGYLTYEAEYAKSGRAKCKEYGCGGTIEKDSMRLGIKQNFTFSSVCGWFHPKCLWKTFNYKMNPNRRITNAQDEIFGYEVLAAADRKTLDNLVKNPPKGGGKGGVQKNLPTPSGTFRLTCEHGSLLVSGNTFSIKDDLKEAGASWNFGDKVWFWPEDVQPTGLYQCALPRPPADGEEVLVEIKTLKRSNDDGVEFPEYPDGDQQPPKKKAKKNPPAKKATKKAAKKAPPKRKGGRKKKQPEPESESEEEEDEAEDMDAEGEIPEDLSSYRVPELRQLCKDNGLPHAGRKAELIERLEGAR